VPVSASVLEERLDARLLLHEYGERQGAHASAASWTVGDRQYVHATNLQHACVVERRRRIVPGRREHFDGQHELPARQRVSHA
jgi:hypothetical protein